MIPQGTLPWQFYGKIWVYAFIRQAELEYGSSDSKIFNSNILPTPVQIL